MNARPNLARLDELGQRLADQAFRTLISLCPEIRSASPARQEAVCAAMRAKVAPSIDSLLEDARLVPCLAEAAFHNAVLTLALAGVEALQANAASPMYRTTTRDPPVGCPGDASRAAREPTALCTQAREPP
jgi:hypothetical protein